MVLFLSRLLSQLRTKYSTAALCLLLLCISALYLQQWYWTHSLAKSDGNSQLDAKSKDCTCKNSTQPHESLPGLAASQNHNAGASSTTITYLTSATTRPPANLLLLPNRTTPAGVPLLLHFVYKDTNILEAYRPGLESCIRLNNNWTVMLWTDETVKIFITQEYPQYKNVFYGYPHKLQRSDAIRYLILYKYGGVYMDMDMTCRRPLLTSLSSIPCFLDKERTHQSQFVHGLQHVAMNSAMGCVVGHPFFKKFIEFVLNPDRLKSGFSFPYTIFETTGPFALTNLYDEWIASKSLPGVLLLNESYFSPKLNPKSGVYGTCRNVVRYINRNSLTLSIRDKACLEIEKLGFEKGDQVFTTNLTVAIHEFTHLGYSEQNSAKFDIFKLHPGVLLYTNLTRI